MKYASTILAAALALIPAVVSAQIDTVATPISLSDAILMAQKNAPAAVQARGSISTADASVKQSYAAFLPSFNISAGSQHQQGDRFDTQGNLVPFTGNPTNYSTSLSSSLQLFDGGRRFFDIKKTKADVHAAEAGETVSRYQIALQVKQQ
jgi:outer membrane protein TolC